MRKLTIQHCIALANKRGGKCLSTEYKNMHTKLLWECKDKHRWEKPLTKVEHNGQWCPLCSKRPPLSLSDCILEASKKDGKCLSTKYINCEEKLLWECSSGHQWYAILRSVRLNGSWCPQCKPSKNQNKLMKILENILSDKAEYNYKGFSWLRNPYTNRKLEIDICFLTIKLAVEYDGRQHFMPVDRFGGKDEFLKVIERDKIKNKLIASSNDIKYFIRFNYKDKINEDVVIKKLKNVGVI